MSGRRLWGADCLIEAACGQAEHAVAADSPRDEVGIFVDAVLAIIEPVESYFIWRPLLRDPAGEMVLEAAANGHADAIADNYWPLVLGSPH